MKRILRLNRTCRRVMPVTLTEVKVQVTQNRMILRPRWWLMLNNMSLCNVLTLGKDFTGKDDLIGAKYSKLWKLEMVPER